MDGIIESVRSGVTFAEAKLIFVNYALTGEEAVEA